ncbi:hypothetical protein L249_5073 [Ophiocordyceps polyrhachis-furcata BCC 54312]|uniref:Uncharacterized protein n=1 Tax=Ophiocordyceps polyrhachis-furcata BCC 54312 TaxID=1330021 RepID=A0A367L3E6_9HYPO|nr:hypothetical protein L249_5073 [Ophiocordyceps polyrhachis-furcata BCC 54312]
MDEQRLPAKLLEALKNPNWRQRRSSSSSSNAGCEMTGYDGSKSRSRHTSSSDFVMVEPDNINNRKISATDRQFNTRSHTPARAVRSLDDDDQVCRVIRHATLDTSRYSEPNGPQLFEMTARDPEQPLDYNMPLAVMRPLKPCPPPMLEPPVVEAVLEMAEPDQTRSTTRLPSNKDAAFRRLLDKLNRSAATTAATRSREANDSGYGTAAGSDEQGTQMPAPPPTSDQLVLQMLVDAGGRRAGRELTVSDSPLNYYRPPELNVADEGVKFRHDLNPKAREFLSFVREAAMEQQSSATKTAVPDGANCVTPKQNATACNPVPVPMPVLYPLTLPQVPEMSAMQLAPFLGVANAAVMEAAAMAAVAARAPLFPCPKPAQAYEAYIEQRKAMEPGYAMECRLRQQRRAKRAHQGRVQYSATQLLMLRSKP